MAKLDQDQSDQIELLRSEATTLFREGKIDKADETLKKAWDQLPGNKTDFPESFIIAKYMAIVNMKKGDLEEAKRWSETLLNCDLERADSGEREFMHGKVCFEKGELEAAKNNFNIANVKSKGRCFVDEDKKYKKLALS